MDFGSCWGQYLCCLLLFLGGGCGSGAGLEAEAIVAGFEYVAAVGQAVEQSRGHLGITKDCGPFAEAEVCGYDDAGALVEFAQQVEEQRASRGAEGRRDNAANRRSSRSDGYGNGQRRADARRRPVPQRR